MSNPTVFENMNVLLGSNFQVVSNGMVDPIVLAKLPNEDLAPKNAESGNDNDDETQKQQSHEYKSSTVVPRSSILLNPTSPSSEKTNEPEKTTDDYLFQVYLGSLTVVGLFILFRMIQKSK